MDAAKFSHFLNFCTKNEKFPVADSVEIKCQMWNKFVISFGRVKPTDIAVFITINVLVGAYVWKPMIREMAEKNNQAKTEAQSPAALTDSNKE